MNETGAILNKGNLYRLQKVFLAAQQEKEVTVAFLGGSITQGSVASTEKKCYAYLVYEWWCQTFPNAKINYVNAGIGATDSQFGCARVDKDVLAYQPDVVFVEFSVNDEANDHYMETYEGLVRRILQDKCKPAVILIHNAFYDTGRSAVEVHLPIGKRYKLPCVSIRESIWQKIARGEIEENTITLDHLHPNDLGHRMLADVVCGFLKQAVQCGETDEEDAETVEALTKNRYEHSLRLQNWNSRAECEGFEPDTEQQQSIRDIFKGGWTAAHVGDKITFDTEGRCIAVQYRKTIQKPAPIAKLTIDGDKTMLLDANFAEDWGDKLVLDTVLESCETAIHKVQIEIVESHAEDRLPFYLSSIIVSGNDI